MPFFRAFFEVRKFTFSGPENLIKSSLFWGYFSMSGDNFSAFFGKDL
jgi:hypothetical protein